MEFHEKLQALRKQKGLTQEELAAAIYVSRTAVSKWEAGRGYPNIDSLKALATFFSVTIDALLSGEELLTIAEEDHRQTAQRLRDLVFALLDCSSVMLLFLPIFGQKTGPVIQGVSLLALDGIAPYLKAVYWIAVIGMAITGLLTLALQSCRHAFWIKSRHKLSLALHAAATILFMISLQPYAAVLLFIFLIIKGLLLIKR